MDTTTTLNKELFDRGSNFGYEYRLLPGRNCTASAETISSSGERFAGVTCTETIGSFSFSEELQPNPAVAIMRTCANPKTILELRLARWFMGW